MPEQLKRAELAFTGAEAVKHPQLEQLLRLWESQRNGSALPAANNFSAYLLKPWLGNLATVAVVGGRFRVMSMGPVCVEIAGGSNVGRCVDDCVAHGDRKEVLVPYHASVTQSAPLFSNALYARPGHSQMLVHRLYLPCADDGREIDTLMIAVYPQDARGMFGPAPKAVISLQ